MATRDHRSPTVSAAPGAGSGALVRLGWMMGGPLTMLIAGFTILNTPAWTFTVRDALFWFGAVIALALRYLDFARFQGQTSNGDSATMVHFRRYAVGLMVVATIGWALAQAVHA